jgi:hypothetical protein
MNTKDITLQDILTWIVLNKDDVDAMQDINKTTFAFIPKSRSRDY